MKIIQDIKREIREKINPVDSRRIKYIIILMKINNKLFKLKFKNTANKHITKKIINKDNIPTLLFLKSFLLKEICDDTENIK